MICLFSCPQPVLIIVFLVLLDAVECQSVEEAIEAAAAGADIVMLDNFTHETIGEAASKVKQVHPHVLLEASGVITCLIYICLTQHPITQEQKLNDTITISSFNTIMYATICIPFHTHTPPTT